MRSSFSTSSFNDQRIFIRTDCSFDDDLMRRFPPLIDRLSQVRFVVQRLDEILMFFSLTESTEGARANETSFSYRNKKKSHRKGVRPMGKALTSSDKWEQKNSSVVLLCLVWQRERTRKENDEEERMRKSDWETDRTTEKKKVSLPMTSARVWSERIVISLDPDVDSELHHERRKIRQKTASISFLFFSFLFSSFLTDDEHYPHISDRIFVCLTFSFQFSSNWRQVTSSTDEWEYRKDDAKKKNTPVVWFLLLFF